MCGTTPGAVRLFLGYGSKALLTFTLAHLPERNRLISHITKIKPSEDIDMFVEVQGKTTSSELTVAYGAGHGRLLNI